MERRQEGVRTKEKEIPELIGNLATRERARLKAPARG